jgi:hypothetical protein
MKVYTGKLQLSGLHKGVLYFSFYAPTGCISYAPAQAASFPVSGTSMMGSTVRNKVYVLVVGALCYKPERREFDSR